MKLRDSSSPPTDAATVAADLLRRALDHVRAHRVLPESTYRLQFHKGFTFRDAAAVVPYLADLGVSHVYASPYMTAVPGSTHGYDVIDHNRLNPELGTQADYDAFVRTMTDRGLSHVLDTVPNHVGVGTNHNAWWNDLLEHGPASAYANHFDVNWRGPANPALHDKVLLPVLGKPYRECLDAGELRLTRDGGRPAIAYYDRRFPVAPGTLQRVAPGDEQRAVDAINGTPGDPASFNRLDALLDAQHYRLAHWKTANDDINYRRFFDVNDLAALAMERQDVFDAAHDFTLRLAATGAVAGLRIDHPDGLYDPHGYFLRLQRGYVLAVARGLFEAEHGTGDARWDAVRAELAEQLLTADLSTGTGAEKWPLYVVAEKILAAGEPLPEAWAVHGTSGYDFLNEANGLFVDGRNEAAFTDIYHAFAGDATPFDELVYGKKRLILERPLGSELRMLADQLARLAARDPASRGFGVGTLTAALREMIACFPVYRSYVGDAGPGPTDVAHIERSTEGAIARNPGEDRAPFHFVRDTLLLRYPTAGGGDALRDDQRRFAAKFQQLTSPATAKGIEDTAFYVYNRFVSINEVGGDPDRFGVTPDALHAYLADRQANWPHAMSTLSTHDTKRSEDVRARLNVLSEMPDEWRACVDRWRGLNARHKVTVGGVPAPDANEEYLIYQTLIGAWPLEPWSSGAYDAFVARVQAYLTKALREAKLHTAWGEPNAAYESAVTGFVGRLLDRSVSGHFLDDFARLRKRVARLGLYNGLSQTLLRLTAPGVPDTYQGTELWDFSLVDPDNRRPVDYATRRAMLDDVRSTTNVRELAAAPDDGRAKLLVTHRALELRRRFPGLFTGGEYLPLQPAGPRAENAFAFARRHDGRAAIVILPRLVASLAGDTDRPPMGDETWGDTTLSLPASLGGPFVNAFTGTTHDGGTLRLADVLDRFPVGLLIGE